MKIVVFGLSYLGATAAACLLEDGHTVVVQRDAGLGSGIADHEYEAMGAKILDTARDVGLSDEMINNMTVSHSL